MALALTLQVGQGFYIRDRRWYVESYDDNGVWLVGPPKAGDEINQVVRITEREAVEIEPDVFAQEGYIPEAGCRVVLDAPRKIAILRDDLYHGGHSRTHAPSGPNRT